MKDSFSFQDGGTLVPLDVVVVKDRSQSASSASVPFSSLSVNSATVIQINRSSRVSMFLGVAGLLVCSGVFAALGHAFSVLAKNWDGAFGLVQFDAPQGWGETLHRSWALSQEIEGHSSARTLAMQTRPARFYRQAFLDPTAAATRWVLIGTQQIEVPAFVQVERPESEQLSIQELQLATQIEYSEQKVEIYQPPAIRHERGRYKPSIRDRAPILASQSSLVSSPALSVQGAQPVSMELAKLSPAQTATEVSQSRLKDQVLQAPAVVPVDFNWSTVSAAVGHLPTTVIGEEPVLATQAKPKEATSGPSAGVVATVVPATAVAAPSVLAPEPEHTDVKASGIQASVPPVGPNKCEYSGVIHSWTRAPKDVLEKREFWQRILPTGSKWEIAYFGVQGSCAPKSDFPAMLEKAQIQGRAIHAEMGILFGEVAKGWTVEVLGRSTNDLIWLDDEGAALRRFYWANLPPGLSVVRYFQLAFPQEMGAVTIPVQSQVATHIDLSHIRRVTLAGKVKNGSSKRSVAKDKVEVLAIHHRAPAVETDRDGTFVIAPLWLAGNYPIDLEARIPGGWTYRYSQDLGKDAVLSDQLTLFVLDPKQVQGWLGALQGGVSRESALVVGAVSAQSRSNLGVQTLLPQIEPWEHAVNLEPESYTIDREGELRPGAPIEDGADRFVIMQVPAGPSRVVFTDHRDQEKISELRYHSPGVISIVGPY